MRVRLKRNAQNKLKKKTGLIDKTSSQSIQGKSVVYVPVPFSASRRVCSFNRLADLISLIWSLERLTGPISITGPAG